jgi:hypothetical protein
MGRLKPINTRRAGIAESVSRRGVSETAKRLEEMKTFVGRSGPGKHLQKDVRAAAERGIRILGGAPFAPGIAIETQTEEETRTAERKRILRRKGRRRAFITGELAPAIAGKKTLLG